MRNITIAQNEFYHIFNRGNDKQLIFLDKRDWVRFIFLIIHLQSPIVFQNPSRQVNYFIKNKVFNFSKDELEEINNKKYVALVNFVLMPNHFHLTLCEHKEGGISQYMQRVLCAYTKYFNTKYKKSGHLFQGPYKAVWIKDNDQLLYLSTYIHKNPRELPTWRDKESLYPWSSYQDYTQINRWDKLLSLEVIMEQFLNKKDYDNFIKSSTAKKDENYLANESFFK